MIEEFKKFVMRGNVIDLAVAVVLGVAFGAIVLSLTNDILMPLVGILLGGVDFASLSVTVGTAVLAYGKFIQAIINFVLIALALFFIVKALNRATESRKPVVEAAPPPPTEDVVLLREIRDLLQRQQR